jgi:predicted RNA-binding Zn ribbon-like protein
MRADRTPPTARSLNPEKPFRFIAGDPSIDFVNTVDWTARGLEHERITDYERFIEWTEAAAIMGGTEAQRVRRGARASPRRAAGAHQSALWTRWVLQRLYAALATETLDPKAVREFNELLGDALARMQVKHPSARGPRRSSEVRPLVRSWRGMGEELESPLWPVLWHACALVTSQELSLLRMCAGEDCGWMYLDRSRNGRRRWCRMATCGTREKNRRRTHAEGISK